MENTNNEKAPEVKEPVVNNNPLFAATPAPAPAPVVTGAHKVVAEQGSSVRMRAKASTSSAIVSNVPVGSEVNVISVDGDWAKIEYTRTGYMMKSFLAEDKK